ncbi:host attachment protein [soil metagenome]
MLIFHGTIISVVDGAKLSVFRNSGRDFGIHLDLVEHREQHSGRTADLGTDTPGRSFNSAGTGRSAYEATDFHQADEDSFAKSAVAQLNSLAKESDIDFIIIAAPHVLGVMRKHYSADLKKRLIAEIDKDYTGRRPADIIELLQNHDA